MITAASKKLVTVAVVALVMGGTAAATSTDWVAWGADKGDLWAAASNGGEKTEAEACQWLANEYSQSIDMDRYCVSESDLDRMTIDNKMIATMVLAATSGPGQFEKNQYRYIVADMVLCKNRDASTVKQCREKEFFHQEAYRSNFPGLVQEAKKKGLGDMGKRMKGLTGESSRTGSGATRTASTCDGEINMYVEDSKIDGSTSLLGYSEIRKKEWTEDMHFRFRYLGEDGYTTGKEVRKDAVMRIYRGSQEPGNRIGVRKGMDNVGASYPYMSIPAHTENIVSYFSMDRLESGDALVVNFTSADGSCTYSKKYTYTGKDIGTGATASPETRNLLAYEEEDWNMKKQSFLATDVTMEKISGKEGHDLKIDTAGNGYCGAAYFYRTIELPEIDNGLKRDWRIVHDYTYTADPEAGSAGIFLSGDLEEDGEKVVPVGDDYRYWAAHYDLRKAREDAHYGNSLKLEPGRYQVVFGISDDHQEDFGGLVGTRYYCNDDDHDIETRLKVLEARPITG